MPEIETLPLDRIVTEGTQARNALSETIIREYADAMTIGDESPPIDVYCDDTTYWLADGFHRVHAARQAGHNTIAAIVHQGGKREAILHAVHANETHGHRRTDADRRRAVTLMLSDAEWCGWSDREIARQCHVSHMLVNRMRREITPPEETRAPAQTRKAKRGQQTYTINIVDEVTQWEMIATVPAISEEFLKPVIEELLACFPFVIHEFHSDNGSEFINHVTAELLTKLYIRFTKSRARHSNDNALVESKNGSIIRKLYGHTHLPASWAPTINEFNRRYVNIYLNYHRPSGFAEITADRRGKEKKKYTSWMTPFEKFRSLDTPEQYLKSNITLEMLENIATAKSDNEFAQNVQQAKVELFKKLRAK